MLQILAIWHPAGPNLARMGENPNNRCGLALAVRSNIQILNSLDPGGCKVNIWILASANVSSHQCNSHHGRRTPHKP
jgi:hypothetical protein